MTGGAAHAVRITNLHDFANLGHLEFRYVHEVDGGPHGHGWLDVPPLAPGESAVLELSTPPDEPDDDGEAIWTVQAVLDKDTAWAPAGHEVAWGQLPAAPRPAATPPAATATPRRGEGNVIVLGPGTFDAATGTLGHLDGVRLGGPRLDVWRAPTDNDEAAPWQPGPRPATEWRRLGLHRMRHRVDAVETGPDSLVVRTRVAPAGTSSALRTVYHWTAQPGLLRLELSVDPEGDWPVPLPRLGVRMRLCGSLGLATWFGGGPGEGYPDTRAAARISRWSMPVDALQTPYVRPQENGARPGVRWAELTRTGGSGLRIEGDPDFFFAARRWPAEELTAARHTTDLRPGEDLWVHLDHAQHGIGSQSCGPGVLPQHRLEAAPARFSFVFSSLG